MEEKNEKPCQVLEKSDIFLWHIDNRASCADGTAAKVKVKVFVTLTDRQIIRHMLRTRLMPESPAVK